MSEAAERAAEAERRGATYWLLARLVLESPAPPLLEELNRRFASTPIDPEEPLGPEVLALRDAVTAASATSGVLELQVEHTRLWGGLSKHYGPPPPYESVVREGRLPGDATTAVAAAYAAAGVDPEAPEAGPADHLAIELRYVAICCVREAAAWKAADVDSAARWNARQAHFLDDHLLTWAPDHCAAVAEQAKTAYERAVAALIARALPQGRLELE